MSDSHLPQCSVCCRPNTHGGLYCRLDYCNDPPPSVDCFGKPFQYLGMDGQQLEDELDTVITDSIDQDWSPRWAARDLVRWLKQQQAQAIVDARQQKQVVQTPRYIKAEGEGRVDGRWVWPDDPAYPAEVQTDGLDKLLIESQRGLIGALQRSNDAKNEALHQAEQAVQAFLDMVNVMQRVGCVPIPAILETAQHNCPIILESITKALSHSSETGK